MRFGAGIAFVVRLAALVAATGVPAATGAVERSVRLIPVEAPAVYTPRPRPGHIVVCGTPAVAPERHPAASGSSTIRARAVRLVVERLPFGPRLREASRDDGPPTADTASQAMAAVAEQLRACYRWARQSEPELETSLEVALQIDDWGGVTSVEAEPATPRAARLAGCAREQLAGLAFGRSVGHPTIVHRTIRFHRTGLGRPHAVARPRPAAPLLPPPRLCVSGAQVFPDMLHLPEMSVDDDDPAQRALEDCERRRRKAREEDDEWRRRHPDVPAAPSRTTCASTAVRLTAPEVDISSDAAAEHVAARLAANLGELRSCFAAAFERSSAVQGPLELEVSFDRRGFVQALRPGRGQRGRGAAADARPCVEDALRAVWLEPVGRPIDVNVTIVLQPHPAELPHAQPHADTPEGVERRARRALAAGDGAVALGHLSSLLQHLPDDPRRCDWLADALVAAQQIEPWLGERTLDAFEALAAHVEKTGPTRATLACVDRASDAVARLAVSEHATGERLKQARSLALAVERYRRILQAFAGSPRLEELQYQFARALWGTEDFCAAASAYDDVAVRLARLPAAQRDERFRDAFSAAVLAWKNCLFAEQLVAQLDDPEEAEAAKERARRLNAAFRRYIEHGRAGSGEERALPVGIEEDGQAAYCEKAAADVRVALESRSLPARGFVSAAHGFFECLVMAGKTSDALAWVTKLLATREVTADERVWQELLAWKSELQGRVLASSGQFKECGLLMQAAADSGADRSTWQHANRLWLAGRCFQRGGLTRSALEVNQRLITDHLRSGAPPSEHRLASAAVARVAAGYETVGDLARAADYYEMHSREQASALASAVALRVELADFEKAAADVSLFVSLYSRSQPESAAALFYRLGDVYEQKKQLDRLAKHLATYLKRWGHEGGPDREILARFRLGELLWQRAHPPATSSPTAMPGARNRASRRAAEEHFESAIRLWVRGGVVEKVGGADASSRLAAAEAAVAGATFYLAEAAAHDVALQNALPRRSELLDRARARYLVTLGYNVAPWAIAAAARVGQLYLHQRDLLRNESADATVVFEARAMSSFEKCVELATEHSSHGDWSRLCEHELHTLRPTRYPLPAEIAPEPSAPAPALAPTGILPMRSQ